MTEWNRTQFNDELQALLNIRPPITMSKIRPIRNLAIGHPESQNYIVQTICKFIETSPPDYRMAGLFLIDSIVRHCKDKKEQDRIAGEYRKRFSVVLKEGLLTGLFSPCHAEDKARIEKLLNYWSENVYSTQFVDPLKISLVQDTDITRPLRRPVVLPSNYATEMALQQQGWQTVGNSAPTMGQALNQNLRTSISPQPMDSMNTYATLTSPPPPPPQQQQQQPGILPQLPIPMTDFSNAVMHFISALNYRPVPATNYVVEQPLPPTPNDSTPLYTLSSLTAIQQPQDYPYLSYPMTASSGDTQNDKTEGDTIYNSVKQEEKPKDYQVPTCQLAEQMANHLSESTMTMNEERELGSISTMTSNNMAATTITDETTDFSQAFVKREFPNDTPFDRPILASATYPVLSPSQQQHQQQQVTEDSLPQQNVNQVHNPPRQVVVEPPRTPPRRQNVDPPRTPPPQNNNELLSQQTIPPPPRTPPHQIIEPSSTPPRKPNNSISITTGADVDPLRIPSTQHVAAVKPPTTPPRKSMTIPRPSTPPPIRKDTERNPSLSTPQKTVLNPPRTPPCQNMDHFSHSPSPKQQQKIPRPRTPPRPESKARRISPTKNTTSPPKDNSFVATSNMTETTALRQDDKVLVNIKKPKPSPDVQNAVLPMKITEPIKSDNSNTIKPPKTPPFKPKKIIQQDSIESNKMDKEAKRSTQPTTTKRVARPKTPPRHMHMDIDQGDGLVSNNNSVESDSKPILPVAPPKTPPRVPKKRLPDPPPFTLDKNTMESNFSRKKQIIDSSLNGGLVSPSQSSLHTTAGTSPPTPTHANTTRRRQSRWGIRGDS